MSSVLFYCSNFDMQAFSLTNYIQLLNFEEQASVKPRKL